MVVPECSIARRSTYDPLLRLFRSKPTLTVAILAAVLWLTVSSPAQDSASKETPRTAPQVQEVLNSYEGQQVVAVEVAGQPKLDSENVSRFLVQKEGEPFSKAKIDQAVAALKASGLAKEVVLEVRPQPAGIRVMFILQPAFYFGIYTFPGAERFAYSRLLQVADYPPRGAYSPFDVRHTTDSLVTFFQKNGYFQVQVHPELETDEAHGLVNVAFQVAPGRRARFGKVRFEDAPPSIEPRLQRALTSLRARVRGAAIRPGKAYSLRTIQRATQYLESKLISADYLGSRVELKNAEYDPGTRRADLVFRVTSQAPVHVRVEGAHLWSWTRRKLLPIYEQAELDPELIQEGRQNLISHFQSKGFLDVRVTMRSAPEGPGESIVYEVTKGPRNKVKEVDIAGNRRLSDSELKGHISVAKAGWLPFLSHGKVSDQLARESARNLEKVYKAEGFSSVKVTPEVVKKSGNVIVRFRVEEGPQDIVEVLRLAGNNKVREETLAPRGLKAVEGQPYSTKKVDEDRNQILAQYLRLGYLNASFRADVAKVNNNPHRLALTYSIIEGPRVTVNSVVTLGARSTKQSLINQAVGLKTEAPMREDDLLTAENRLYKLGIFDWAQIDPRRQITTQDQEDVLVKVHESQENEIRYGFGFEVINRGGNIPSGTVAVPGIPPTGLPSGFQTSEKTFWGPRGTFQYTHKNFRGMGETITIGLLGARLLQRAGISYTDPFFAGAYWSSNLAISVERNSENPIFTSRLGDFGFQVERMLNAAGNKTLSLRYGFRRTSLTQLLIEDLVPPEDRNLRLSTLAAAYSFDTRDNPLDATRGKYQTVDFDLNLKGLGSTVNFARLRAQAAHYKQLGAGIVWANSIRVGVAVPFADSRVPVSELFFSGGGSTLRGFPLNGAGPQRAITVCIDPSDPSTCSKIQAPQGGRELFIVNSEFRFPLPLKKGLGIAAFYDGGNVFQHVGFGGFRTDYTNTVGVGLRYKTPVGPVRVDIGHNLNAPPGIKSTQLFITLGQAF